MLLLYQIQFKDHLQKRMYLQRNKFLASEYLLYITSEPLALSCSVLHLVVLPPLKSFFLFTLVILSLPNNLGLVEVGLRIDTAEGIVIPPKVGKELVLGLKGGKLSVVER